MSGPSKIEVQHDSGDGSDIGILCGAFAKVASALFVLQVCIKEGNLDVPPELLRSVESLANEALDDIKKMKDVELEIRIIEG